MPKFLRLSGALIAFIFGLSAFSAGICFALKAYSQEGELMALGGMLGALYMGIGWIMITVAYFSAKGIPKNWI